MEKFRLLALEDNKDIAKLICATAENLGFESFSSAGAQSPAAYRQCKPHVIVLDILMPGMDGFEFLSFLKEEESTSQIIIFSGSSDTYRRMAENIGRLSGLNIAGNLPKPFRLMECRTLLERVQQDLC